ncbi:hypothetical protein H9Q08_07175 [Chryseobacterium sp. PS-8]|uniref:Alpha-ketoglutarate-dependent dioxygenase AlkB-like domain-containing protein n=1 Tax=Chryseobacterium indicum TaxID=2766954 RepID=A0ABS9C4I7_9FLAO|nr:hypothetical protein [Chryseobacterium sp. PS-8]MCF2219082.1 hypothetical protein [Chryseobacterium sp. PS-8]
MNNHSEENKISKDKNVLVVLNNSQEINTELQYIMDHFCGTVVHELSPELVHQKIYICGDLENIPKDHHFLHIIKEFSVNFENISEEKSKVIQIGEVPVIVSNAGVYFRRLFHQENIFEKVKSEHRFQELTESNKEAKALRKGIYLSKVTHEANENGEETLHFNLLRCSSNLTGPTDNFRETDRKIIALLNECAKETFEYETDLNHALVQIYENKKKTSDAEKEVKAKIKAHSDKTKDMLKEGLIAFCTFYDDSNSEHLKPSETDRFDVCYKQTSALTRLHFRLKKTVEDESLEKEFTVTLYPDSAFIIPLSTNRLYTHEIRPSVLGVDQIPIRMGYVVRCSNLEAMYRDNQTYIKENDNYVKLESMTPEMQAELRNSYYEENMTENKVNYKTTHFSMNLGDYEKPIL